MRLLADSCVLVWWLSRPDELRPAARAALEDPENEVWFSAASVWELGLKIAKGKLKMPVPFVHHLTAEGFQSLPVTVEHAEQSLVLPPHHADPFDRMLIAQAVREQLIFVTRDEIIPKYPLQTLAA